MSTDRNAFKAVLWKEFRENLKWGVLGLLLVSVGVVYIFERLINRSLNGWDLNWTDLSFSLFLLPQIFTSIVGLMIGLAQVLLENRGDKWGFLTHRPVPRSALFRGKVVAGVLLYIVAVGVPLSCGILWMATPGHLPMPFESRFVLPVLADLLCGLVYYFAGLLTGMREARWHASRVMGIGMGIVCSLALNVVTEFWQAAACCALAILVSGAAAWGAFVEGGRFESQSRLARFATGIAIGAGLLITGAVVFNAAASFVPARIANSRNTNYTVTGDGAIVQAV
ncbi:MAG TPA: ABC transporter permease, partial [Terriglobia bacterium]|nr:ABC transporter permease [Terriglobia bacterium]